MEELLNRLGEVPLLLPLAIMLLRIADVSLGTVRVVMVFRGRALEAALLGFFEVTIWLTAIAGIVSNLDNWLNIIAYGAGFALGNVIGLAIDRKMAVGQQVVRFISLEESEKITRLLRARGYGVTEVVASGRQGPVGLGFVITSRKKVPEMERLISSVDPKSVITVEDVRHSNVVDYLGTRNGSLGLKAFFKKK